MEEIFDLVKNMCLFERYFLNQYKDYLFLINEMLLNLHLKIVSHLKGKIILISDKFFTYKELFLEILSPDGPRRQPDIPLICELYQTSQMSSLLPLLEFFVTLTVNRAYWLKRLFIFFMFDLSNRVPIISTQFLWKRWDENAWRFNVKKGPKRLFYLGEWIRNRIVPRTGGRWNSIHCESWATIWFVQDQIITGSYERGFLI